MKKQTIKRLILSFIAIMFVFSFTYMSVAASSSMSSLYSNPNSSSNNPYKFKVSTVVNSNLLTSVVGCTGVVNKVASWMINFVQSPYKTLHQKKIEIQKYKNQLRNACAYVKSGAEAGAGSVVGPNDIVTPVKQTLETQKLCESRVDMMTDDAVQYQMDQEKQQKEVQLKEQCFDGIAITLAKNQLTSMTRKVMNWVNSGYGGNPLFVQNMQRLTTNIERNVVETGIDILLAPETQSPYASSFAESTYRSEGVVSSSAKFLGNLSSSLSNFLSDPKSYYSNEDLTTAERSKRATESYNNNFSYGGWDGWLAFTQIDGNNPLGYNVAANQYLSGMRSAQVENMKDEARENNGFMSQKECVKWLMYNADGTPKRGSQIDGSGGITGLNAMYGLVYTESRPNENQDGVNEYGVCTDWKVITPGSLIKDKVSTYLNSPERQLELVDTINDSLNALFSILLDKLQDGGLSSLSDSSSDTSNWTDNINSLQDYTSSDGNSTYNNNGAYNDFNITKDLGNTYIHGDLKNLGNWNASKNTTSDIKRPKLYTSYSSDESDIIPPTNSYYVVTTAGNYKLIDKGYNGWEIGDRAFWDGEKWQNWKKGQTNPIKKRGVIQIQQDYIVAAKEIMQILPSVMTSLGKLDYCIPGPNPSYKTNSTDSQSAYQAWVGSIQVGPIDTSGKRFGWTIDHEDSRTYKDLAEIFSNNTNTWKQIRNSEAVTWLLNTFGPFEDDRDWYNYDPDKEETRQLNTYQDLMDDILDYTNSHMFTNFYEVFDKMMDKIYFKNMTSRYLEYENRDIVPGDLNDGIITGDENPAYVPMAASGLEIVKNISYYDEDISDALAEYKDALNQAKINISRLDPIKNEISSIIKAAQARRDANKAKIKSDFALKYGRSITDAEYAKCVAEENVEFFDADDITGVNTYNEERCNNGIDDDLDGLVDENDPDCSNYNPTNSRANASDKRN